MRFRTFVVTIILCILLANVNIVVPFERHCSLFFVIIKFYFEVVIDIKDPVATTSASAFDKARTQQNARSLKASE